MSMFGRGQKGTFVLCYVGFILVMILKYLYFIMKKGLSLYFIENFINFNKFKRKIILIIKFKFFKENKILLVIYFCLTIFNLLKFNKN